MNCALVHLVWYLSQFFSRVKGYLGACHGVNSVPSHFASDEATFHVRGRVNRRSCRVWGSENPSDVTEHERDSPKENVW